MVGVRRSYPRFKREGEAPRLELTSDDTAIVQCIYRYRFVRADDLYRLFPDRTPDRLSRRLTLLYRTGFIDRPIAQIDRFGRGGSQALVYGLDAAGARYLKETLGVPIGIANWRSRNRSYTRDNLDHTLAVSRFMIDMELACRSRDDLSLIPFEDILRRAPEETRRSPLPGRWPVSIQFCGARGIVYLAPDAIFGLRLKGADGISRVSNIFIEIDRGTMTIVPAERIRESDAFLHRSTVLRKLVAYADSWQQECHNQHLGIFAPRLLMLTRSAARAKAIRAAACELVVKERKLPSGVFLFGALGDDCDLSRIELVDSYGNNAQLLQRTAC